MKQLLTILFLLTITALPAFAQAERQELKLVTTQIALDNEYPMVVVDHVPYALFGLPKSGTGRPHFSFEVTERTRSSLFWIKDVEVKDRKLRFYWYVPSTDGNAPLVNGISVSITKNADQEEASLDPKVNAGEFIRRTVDSLVIKDECAVNSCVYEYYVDKQPTGKFLAFADVDSEVAAIDKSFKPRKMILSTLHKAALFVRHRF